ncbi:MAG: acyl-ACP--UDP-N-acetylglucosamine O-acyltransferase [Verrucomicrobiota bacterium]
MSIHSTAVVDNQAELDSTVEVGPYCVVGPNVSIEAGTRLLGHVNIQGPTKIGKNNIVYAFTSLGSKTQDLKYEAEPTYLEIGDHNVFRESCTVNRATGIDEKTIIGSFNNFLAYSHIAHNSVVGNHCIFSNNGTLAGHVVVEDYAIIGGLSAIHQFCRVGQHAMIGGCAKIVQDVPPYFVADGNPAAIRAINAVGLKRRDFTDEVIGHIKTAFKEIYNSERNTTQAIDYLQETLGHIAEIKIIVDFIRNSQRGIIR